MAMRISMVMCRPIKPLVDVSPPTHLKRDLLIPRRQKEKLVVILGATGTGKSRLSIDIASCFPAEIINSDKIQAHQGLNIVTNKMTEEEQCGIPHHLLGTIHPNADFTATNFCDMASDAIESISARGLLPIVVGGSNSYVEALITGQDYRLRSMYDCCFLWVDVAVPVLHKFVRQRVDRMVQNGMVDEVRKFFNPNADYSKGIRRAIGVPELDLYFRTEKFLDHGARAQLLEEAIEEIKNNTCKLACRQLEKIQRFQNLRGWNLHRLDATEFFLNSGKEANIAWEELMSGPSTMIVAEFLYNITSSNNDSAGFFDPLEAIRVPAI